jgi:pentatricopeptide repeat protein
VLLRPALQIGHRPDDRLCTTLMRVCAQHGQASAALSLYDWMRTPRDQGGGGLTPTVFTYTAAMRAALTGSLMDRALQVGGDGWLLGPQLALSCCFVQCMLHWDA